jgi:hypothetical protein
MCYAEHKLTIAYSKEENAIVERANQEVIRHLRALLFDKRVYNKWSFEELSLVQRIMNTVEKTATGVTPAELILNNSTCIFKTFLLDLILDLALRVFLVEVKRFLDDEVVDIFKFQ